MPDPQFGVTAAAGGGYHVTVDGEPIGRALSQGGAADVAHWLRLGGFRFIQAVAARGLVAEITGVSMEEDVEQDTRASAPGLVVLAPAMRTHSDRTQP